MMLMSHQELMLSYIEARRAKVPRADQGRVERGGYFLLDSARSSQDGEADLSGAIAHALAAGEVDAALELAERYIPELPTPPRGCNGNFGTSGEIRTPAS